MSRSFKKCGVVKDGNRKKCYHKKQANKRTRVYTGLSDGCSYKRLYNQWEICDYKQAQWWIRDGTYYTIYPEELPEYVRYLHKK